MRRAPIGTAAVLVAVLLAGCSQGMRAANPKPAASPSQAARSATPSAIAATVSASTSTASSALATVAASPSSDSTAPELGIVTIGWVGDTTPGSRYGLAPHQGRDLYSSVRAKLEAPDIMVGNLEGTFGSGGKSKGSSATSFSFQAPMAYAGALSWAGFDVMNVANNHTHDFLETGMASTRRALKAAGVAYTGLPGQITVVQRNGVRVAFIGVAPYPWAQSLANVSGTTSLVRKAAKRADVVIVLMHAGAEGSGMTHTPAGAEHAYGEFRGAPRDFAHAMVDAGATAVLGSGPHVVRGIERRNGGLIAYSLGDFAGWGNFSTSGTLGLSGLLTIRIDRSGAVLGGRWLSLRLVGAGVPALDPKKASLGLVRKLSRQDFSDPWPVSADGTLGAGA